MEEKNDENEHKIKNNDNILLVEDENNKKDLIINKEQINDNDNDINNFSEIIIKLKNILEEIKQSKKQSRIDNINIILNELNKIIDIFSKKIINEENKNNINLIYLSEVLKELQSIFYSNSEILKKIEIICNLIINNIEDNEEIQLFIEIMIESLTYNDNNNKSNMLIISLKLINNILKKYSFLIDSVYDITIPKIFNILNLSKYNDISVQYFCYNILIIFIYNRVFSYDLVNKGLLINIKEVLQQIQYKNNNIIINEKNLDINEVNEISNISYNDLIKEIYILLKELTNVNSNLMKISQELMEILLNEFLNNNYSEDQYLDIKINFFEILMKKENKCIDSFIEYKGIECILKLLKKNENNKDMILKLFHLLNIILTYNKSYNKIMINLKYHEYIKEIIDKMGSKEKEIDFNGKSLLFLIDFDKSSLEEIEEYDFNTIKLKKKLAPPSCAVNFLNSGKIVTIVNELGEIKKKYLYFTQDFLKVIAKSTKSNKPPKKKYIINTINITSIIKGYGTEAFKKSKRFYRSAPELDKCFSIIAFDPNGGGEQSINVICDKKSETNKWIRYIKDIIIFLQENKRILKNINFSEIKE